MIKIIKKLIKKKHSKCAAVIVAAGSSNRMQGTDKILYSLGGEPLICHTIRAFERASLIDQIVIVTREDLIAEIKALCDQFAFKKVTAVIPGGTSRSESVMNGLDHVSNAAFVAVHDGARPFVTDAIIRKTVEKAMDFHAAAPAVPVKDTIKMAYGGIVTHTPDRATLFAVQTPQVFDYDLLRGALTQASKKKTPVTDDCSAVEAIGMSVCLTEGSDENIKITTPTDLILAEAIFERRNPQ